MFKDIPNTKLTRFFRLDVTDKECNTSYTGKGILMKKIPGNLTKISLMLIERLLTSIGKIQKQSESFNNDFKLSVKVLSMTLNCIMVDIANFTRDWQSLSLKPLHHGQQVLSMTLNCINTVHMTANHISQPSVGYKEQL